jgi:hypothetical protein
MALFNFKGDKRLGLKLFSQTPFFLAKKATENHFYHSKKNHLK